MPYFLEPDGRSPKAISVNPLDQSPTSSFDRFAREVVSESHGFVTPLSLLLRMKLNPRRPAYLEAATRTAERHLIENLEVDSSCEAVFMAVCNDGSYRESVYSFRAWRLADVKADPQSEASVFWIAADETPLVQRPRYQITIRDRISHEIDRLLPVPGFSESDLEEISFNRVAAENTPYSERQLEIIKLLAQGLSTDAIAKALFISSDTVRTHRQHILSRSEKPNMISVVIDCVRQGWI